MAAMPRSYVSVLRSALTELDLQNELKGWNENEVKYIDMETATALKIPANKAARLCCRMK
jgi:hypothetical protein